jgi:centromeric protein E
VFSQEFTTDQIYEQNIKKHIESAITGINVTIFAYGQTSSGKTFTMRGTDGKPGLIPLTIQGIFNLTNDSQDSEVDYKITCSYLEIYNESVNDLLDSTKKNLDVRESISQGVYIQGLTNRE